MKDWYNKKTKMRMNKFKQFLLLVLSCICSFGLAGCNQKNQLSQGNNSFNSLPASSSLADLSATDIYKKVNPSTVFVLVAQKNGTTLASGTGFFIDTKGDFVTNYHVVEYGISGSIQLDNGNTASIEKVIGFSKDLDIAVLHANISSSVSGLGDSDTVSVGDTVYAIGYPQAFVLGAGSSTFTSGMVSMNRSINGHNFIQSTVDITNGNSGGPLINNKGQIIGITTAGINYSNIDYMNLSIPINRLNSVAQNLSLDFADFGKKDDVVDAYFYVDGAYWKTINTTYNTPVSDPKYTASEHARFDGWYQDSIYSQKFSFSTPIKKNTTIYGKLTHLERLVSISCSQSTIKPTFSGTGWYKPSSKVTVTASDIQGYSFNGFFFDSQLTKKASSDRSFSFVMPDADQQLWVSYSMTPYKLTIDGNGGSFYYGGQSTNSYEVTIYYTQGFVMPSPKRNSAKFDGWYKGDVRVCGGGETYYQNVCEDVTLKAHWTVYVVVISFDTNGGSAIDNVTINGGDSYTFPEPSKAGFDFLYWYDKNQASSHYAAGSTTSFPNLTFSWQLSLCASWTPHNYSLSFVSTETNETRTYSVNYTGYFTFPTWARNGYSLSGWLCNGILHKPGDTIQWNQKSGDNFTAVWKPNTYTVVLDCNGGSASCDSVDIIFDSNYTLPTPSRDGYKFLGWYNGNSLVEMTGIWRLTIASLKAKWSGESYTVTFDVNGGTALAQTTLTVTFGDNYQLPITTKSGMEFSAWALEDGTKIPTEGVWSIAKDVTLTAQWAEKSYLLSYVGCGDGGEEYESEPTLSYTLNSDGISYTINGLGACTKTTFVIGGFYLGLPVTKIGTSAFDGKASFNKVLIGKTIIEIGAEAFRKCNSALQVYFESDNPPVTVCDPFGYTWDTDAFKTFAPKGAIDAYKAHKDQKTGNSNEDCWQTYLIGKNRLYSYDAGTIGSLFDLTKDVIVSTYSKSSNSALLVPTRNGYVFDGWYSTSTFDEGTKVTSLDTSSATAIILFGKWLKAP
jgi:uncharacterized repeat protein (TIGR02543 family)